MTEQPNRRAHYRKPQQARSAATLARALDAAEDLVLSVGFDAMTMSAVAEHAGMSVGAIYRRFEGKEQLVAALTERIIDRREAFVAKQLGAAEPSLGGVVDAAIRTLLHSFTDTRRLFPVLLSTPSGGITDHGVETIAQIHRLITDALVPYAGQFRQPDRDVALDTVARTLVGACFHSSIRPDRPMSDTDRERYATELRDMTLAYLLNPGPRPDHTEQA